MPILIFLFLEIFRIDICCLFLQTYSNSWSKTVFNYSTEKPNRLPIIDVAIRDAGHPTQEFSIEIGTVCFDSKDRIFD